VRTSRVASAVTATLVTRDGTRGATRQGEGSKPSPTIYIHKSSEFQYPSRDFQNSDIGVLRYWLKTSVGKLQLSRRLGESRPEQDIDEHLSHPGPVTRWLDASQLVDGSGPMKVPLRVGISTAAVSRADPL
jgi:hypothetical protein